MQSDVEIVEEPDNFTTTKIILSINDEVKNNEIIEALKKYRLKMLNKSDAKVFITDQRLSKKDWHNYSKINSEKQRIGIGELGEPALLSVKDKYVENQMMLRYGYNALLSDRISLNRSLPDLRHPRCKTRQHLVSLPTVSVIIPFFNERSSILLRTVYSVLNRSPAELLKEIFLVDDASTRDIHNKDENDLHDFVKRNLPKVKVLHLHAHSGLATARMLGAQASTADVLVILDSHIEANVNWLPPLLEPIARNYRTVVVPHIDHIDFNTFKYSKEDNGGRGAFDWQFTYYRFPLTPQNKKNLPEPFETPVMMGGLFAISRAFFWELGGYDPEQRGWGGEQFELSFKIWQCGGRMLEAPCSRVGHVYRSFDRDGHRTFTARNYRRVAEVWMDEYAEYIYEKRTEVRNANPGDVTEQKALRQKLKCKPFKWFMTQIAFDLLKRFPRKEPLPYAEGRIRPLLNPGLCMDGNNGEINHKFVLRPCYPEFMKLAKDRDDQKFELTWYNDVELKSRHVCWDLTQYSKQNHLTQITCHRHGGNQQWRYFKNSNRFAFVSPYSLCLDHDLYTRKVFANVCNDTAESQRWLIDTIYEDRLDAWNENNTKSVTGPVEEWKE